MNHLRPEGVADRGSSPIDLGVEVGTWPPLCVNGRQIPIHWLGAVL
jgi:hypothetical protein